MSDTVLLVLTFAVLGILIAACVMGIELYKEIRTGYRRLMIRRENRDLYGSLGSTAKANAWRSTPRRENSRR